jgi:hypothetical protein
MPKPGSERLRSGPFALVNALTLVVDRGNVVAHSLFVAHCRVSTDRQGRSGLGLMEGRWPGQKQHGWRWVGPSTVVDRSEQLQTIYAVSDKPLAEEEWEAEHVTAH